jgi:hypothetical protein
VRHRGSSADLDDARRLFLDAYQRGLPVYSLGVQWLVEGLTLFAGGDPESAEVLRTIHGVAGRTIMQEPFTTITLS